MSTNNVVINNTTTGITNQDIQLITQPYQERIFWVAGLGLFFNQHWRIKLQAFPTIDNEWKHP
jgi:hypothetical protein